jgi:DNA-binding GntR family transcriptional regulator
MVQADGRLGDAHRGLTALVRDALRRQIVVGERRPGVRLVEKELAEEFGVSRNPTREALQLLSVEGFVELLPRKGAIVAKVSPDHGEFLFELRHPLEVVAAGAAARRGSSTSDQTIAAVLEAATAPLAEGDVARLSDLNFDFHDAIAKVSGNPYLAEILRPLRWKMQWVFQQTAESRYRSSWQEHRQLAQAIKRGDEAEARRLADHHMQVSKQAYRRSLRQLKPKF